MTGVDWKRISILEKDYPGRRIGLLGSVGGSWRQETDWKCPCCSSEYRVVVWGENGPILEECANCDQSITQLSLFTLPDVPSKKR